MITSFVAEPMVSFVPSESVISPRCPFTVEIFRVSFDAKSVLSLLSSPARFSHQSPPPPSSATMTPTMIICFIGVPESAALMCA